MIKYVGFLLFLLFIIVFMRLLFFSSAYCIFFFSNLHIDHNPCNNCRWCIQAVAAWIPYQILVCIHQELLMYAVRIAQELPLINENFHCLCMAISRVVVDHRYTLLKNCRWCMRIFIAYAWQYQELSLIIDIQAVAAWTPNQFNQLSFFFFFFNKSTNIQYICLTFF